MQETSRPKPEVKTAVTRVTSFPLEDRYIVKEVPLTLREIGIRESNSLVRGITSVSNSSWFNQIRIPSGERAACEKKLVILKCFKISHKVCHGEEKFKNLMDEKSKKIQ